MIIKAEHKQVTRALLVLAIVIFWKNEILPSFIYGNFPGDFKSFYFASKGFWGQGNIYDFEYLNNVAETSGVNDYVYPYLYPPLLAFYMYPLTLLEPRDASRLWALLSAILCMAIVLQSVTLTSVLLRENKQVRTIFLPAFAILLLYLLPFDNNIAQGQVNIIVLAFIVFALVQRYVYNRDFLSGFVIAPAILIKIIPALLLVFFLLSRRYKIGFGFLVGTIVFATPTIWSQKGISIWQQFLHFLPSTSYGKAIPGLFSPSVPFNFSVASFFARWIPVETTVSGLTYVVLFLFLSLLIYHQSRFKEKYSLQLLILPYLILMTVAPPFTYIHHVIYIYPGLLITISVLWKIADRRAHILLLLLIALALIVSINPNLYISAPILRGLGPINLYALLALFFLSLGAPKLQMNR